MSATFEANAILAGENVFEDMDYDDRCDTLARVMRSNYAYFDLPYNGYNRHGEEMVSTPPRSGDPGILGTGGPRHYWMLADADAADADTEGGEGGGPSRGPRRAENVNYNGNRYFYHSDHLGSSSLITDASGNVTQQLDYLPYGEVFLEKRADVDYYTPYRFNGKELDEETGLYYYGARYYNPRLSIWYGTDPLEEKYSNISSYTYCISDPIEIIDPDGEEPVYNTKGDFLGTTSEGFTGAILIYKGNGKPDFKNLSSKQLNSKYIISLDNADKLVNNAAKVKIWNNIASHFNGMEVYDEVFSLSDIYDGKIKYMHPNDGYWSTAPDYNNERSGKPKIYGSGGYVNDYESTVENIASSIIVHEWYSHGKKFNGDLNKSHRLAYQNVINFKRFWNKTTDKYKAFVLKRLKDYCLKEIHKNYVPKPYQRLYKKYVNN